MVAQTLQPDAVLFDLDGTLLDTAPDLGDALNRVLSAHNRPIKSYAEIRPYASHGSYGLLKIGFGDDFNDSNRLPLRQQFLDFYEERVCVNTVLFEEVEGLLKQLAKLGIPMAIVTNKPTLYTALVLEQIPALANVQVVVCGDTLAVAKPNPAPLLHACELLSEQHIRKITPSRCVYVGDAERDIVAGRAAGMKTVLANYGYIAPEDDTVGWQADYSISSPAELLQLLNR